MPSTAVVLSVTPITDAFDVVDCELPLVSAALLERLAIGGGSFLMSVDSIGIQNGSGMFAS